jgi:copper homeostasis protein (lipoprotein)
MKFFFLFFLLVAQGAWGGISASETTSEPAVSDSLGQLPASFIGDLPCASCSGIRYQIDLFPDRIFFRRMSYLGEDKSLDDVGAWDVSPDGNTLTLKDGDKAPDLYAIKDQSTISKLDLDWHKIESALNYDLKRTASFQPIEPQVSAASLQNTYWKLLKLGDTPVVMQNSNASHISS